jgi:4-amino-4-deoxy-L-arabinose transferase-like glycosyltransferase
MPSENTSHLRRATVAVLLALVLATSLALRWQRAPAGLPYVHDWDEPALTATALDMLKDGRANPEFFNYGSLTYYALVAVDVACFFHLVGSRHPAPFELEHHPGIGYSQLDLGSIQTVYDTGFRWQISHPEFVLWNRAFFGLLGTALVGLTFLLGREVGGSIVGLLAAALLAVQEMQLERAAIVNADLPMAFFATVAAWLSLRWLADRRPGWLVGALFAAGFAASAKYNGALAVLAPAAALGAAQLGDRRPRVLWWPALVVVPAVAFLLGSPYALLDLPAFLSQAGFEVYHYGARGHAAVDIEPGWPHLVLELQRMAANLGIAGALLAVGGVVLLVRRRIGLALLLFPMLYALMLSRTLPTFHRHWTVVYPFVVVAAAVAVLTLVPWIAGRVPPTRRRNVTVVLGLAVVGWLAVEGIAVARRGAAAAGPETRTRAVEEVVRLAEDGAADGVRVGVAGELRVHPRDLERLRDHPQVELVEASHLELVCGGGAYDVVMTGGRYTAVWPTSRAEQRLARRLAGAQPALEHREVGPRSGERPVTRLDGLSENPWIFLYRPGGQPVPPPPACAPAPAP